jgi:hypothetical protein
VQKNFFFQISFFLSKHLRKPACYLHVEEYMKHNSLILLFRLEVSASTINDIFDTFLKEETIKYSVYI